jgi:AcrR family transcriptional regulator
VAASGTKITMAQVAASAGVAKATLYNHFRTREAVLAALVLDRVDALIEEHAGKPLARALVDTATALSSHPLRRALADAEPAVLATLGRIDAGADGWQRARAAVAELLARESREGALFVLRWLASFLISPADPATIARDVDLLLAALPPSRPAADVAQPA